MATRTYVVRLRRDRMAAAGPDLQATLAAVPSVRIVNASPQQAQITCDDDSVEALKSALGDTAIVEELKTRGFQA